MTAFPQNGIFVLLLKKCKKFEKSIDNTGKIVYHIIGLAEANRVSSEGSSPQKEKICVLLKK